MQKLKCAVVGVGHLGRHHARILASLPDTQLVAVADTDDSRGRSIAQEYNAAYYSDTAELEALQLDAAVVATPTSHHFKIAKFFIERGVAVMVEKPITTTVEEADELVSLAREKKVPLQVGHIERFNPAMLAVKKHLKQPGYIECQRIGTYSFRSADIGVVHDLMIHDLDMVLHLADSDIVSIDAIGVPVLSKHEDVANARLQFANGCVANLTASRVAFRRDRRIRIFQEDAYFSLDYEAKKARICRKAANFVPPEEIDLSGVTDLRALVFEKMLTLEEVPIDDQEPLKSELEAFVRCVRCGTPPEVGGEDGRKALAAAVEIVRQINQRIGARRT